MSRNVLIFGATGKQGGATVEALLDSPRASEYTMLAVTRNAASASAKKLEERGVKIVQGDMNDTKAVFEEAEKVANGKVWGVFAVQVSTTSFFDGVAKVSSCSGAYCSGILEHTMMILEP